MRVNGQLEVAQLEQLASDPVLSPYGRIYFNTTTQQVRYYNSTSWQALSPGAGAIANVVGSRGSPQAITAAGGVPYSASGNTIIFVVGSGGAVVVTANPQVVVGTVVGQTMTIIGTSNTNTVELQTGTGLQLSGAIVLGNTTGGGNNSSISLVWDGSVWLETART